MQKLLADLLVIIGGHITNSYCTGGVYGIVGDLTAGFAKQGGVIDYCYTTSFIHARTGLCEYKTLALMLTFGIPKRQLPTMIM